jgi:exosortase B
MSWKRGAISEWWPVMLGLLLLYVPTFVGLATKLWHQDDHAHGPIILAMICWLVWQNRQSLLERPSEPKFAAGVGILVIGIVMYVLGRSQDILLFEVGSLLPVSAGAILATRGASALRGLAVPIIFILFLVPLPGFFVDALTSPLKQHVSALAEWVLYTTGFPIARTGVVLTVGSYQLLVADACSGLNSMFSLSALGLLYVYLMHYPSRLHNVLLLLSIVPIAFFANAVRVLVLVLVTYWYGDAAGQGMAHGFAGMALFVIAIFLLFAFDLILRQAGRLMPGRK